jgi:glucan phosphorylase
MIDPATVGTSASILAKITELFNRLRQHQTNKEVYDIVRDLQSEQSKLETKIKEAEAEVAQLKQAMTVLKQRHAAEITQLKQAHAEDIKRMTAEPGRVIPETDESGYGMGDLGATAVVPRSYPGARESFFKLRVLFPAHVIRRHFHDAF